MSSESHTTAADGLLETRDDGKQVLRFERHLAHPVERGWAALTEPEELIAWWGDADVDLVAGGRFTMRWLNTDDKRNRVEMEATITGLEPPSLLEIDGAPHGELRFELRPDRGGTALTFTSTVDLPEEHRAKVLAGWHYHLDALAEALEGRKTELVNLPNERWDRVHEEYLARLP
jgi:uncharacterized protein YndB with AHSA1/START domain